MAADMFIKKPETADNLKKYNIKHSPKRDILKTQNESRNQDEYCISKLLILTRILSFQDVPLRNMFYLGGLLREEVYCCHRAVGSTLGGLEKALRGYALLEGFEMGVSEMLFWGGNCHFT